MPSRILAVLQQQALKGFSCVSLIKSDDSSGSQSQKNTCSRCDPRTSFLKEDKT